MPNDKPRRLNEIIDTFAPEGSNDKRWFLVEHQLEQVKQSAQIVVGSLKIIADNPENEDERQVAEDCFDICKGMFLDIQEHYAQFLSYLSGTGVPERIGRKEI